jgi:hypothetical protein
MPQSLLLLVEALVDPLVLQRIVGERMVDQGLGKEPGGPAKEPGGPANELQCRHGSHPTDDTPQPQTGIGMTLRRAWL